MNTIDRLFGDGSPIGNTRLAMAGLADFEKWARDHSKDGRLAEIQVRSDYEVLELGQLVALDIEGVSHAIDLWRARQGTIKLG